jgi:hypothetical protein
MRDIAERVSFRVTFAAAAREPTFGNAAANSPKLV